MSRVCPITFKRKMSGHNVSHSNRKTRRFFKPNLQQISLYSEALEQKIRVRISVSGLRTIEANGGLDAYLLSTKDSRLAPEFAYLKKVIQHVKNSPIATNPTESSN